MCPKSPLGLKVRCGPQVKNWRTNGSRKGFFFLTVPDRRVRPPPESLPLSLRLHATKLITRSIQLIAPRYFMSRDPIRQQHLRPLSSIFNRFPSRRQGFLPFAICSFLRPLQRAGPPPLLCPFLCCLRLLQALFWPVNFSGLPFVVSTIAVRCDPSVSTY